MISVKFDTFDFNKIRFALEKVKSMAMLQKKDLPYYCAVEFHFLLLNNLNRETFAGGYSSAGGEGFPAYAPYHPRYAAWKRSSGDFWKLGGDLVRNIVKRKFGQGWAVGVNDVKDAGGKSWYGMGLGVLGKAKSIGMYAIVNEFGGDFGQAGRHKGRPLFRPTRVQFQLDGWLKEGDKVITKIANSWS